jgi:hypothetical protein
MASIGFTVYDIHHHGYANTVPNTTTTLFKLNIFKLQWCVKQKCVWQHSESERDRQRTPSVVLFFFFFDVLSPVVSERPACLANENPDVSRTLWHGMALCMGLRIHVYTLRIACGPLVYLCSAILNKTKCYTGESGHTFLFLLCGVSLRWFQVMVLRRPSCRSSRTTHTHSSL